MHKHHHRHATPATSGPNGSTTATATQPTVASGDKICNGQLVCAEDIRLRAYRKWESAGKPTGDGIRFWLDAEQELRQGA